MQEVMCKVCPIINKTKLVTPSGICRNPINDMYYVTDMLSHCVLEFALSDEIARPISRKIRFSYNEHVLEKPLAIMWDSYWGLLVTDAVHNNVFSWNVTEEYWEPIIEDENISLPGSITSDNNGNIYITDFHYNRVCRINEKRDVEEVIVRLDDGTTLIKPYGIFCQGNNLYITDTGNNRIVRYELKSGLSYTVRLSEREIQYPIAIAVDQNNFIFVCEQRRILCFDSADRLIMEIDANTWKKLMHSRLAYAGAIAIIGEMKFLVADTIRGNIYQVNYGGDI